MMKTGKIMSSHLELRNTQPTNLQLLFFSFLSHELLIISNIYLLSMTKSFDFSFALFITKNQHENFLKFQTWQLKIQFSVFFCFQDFPRHTKIFFCCLNSNEEQEEDEEEVGILCAESLEAKTWNFSFFIIIFSRNGNDRRIGCGRNNFF